MHSVCQEQFCVIVNNHPSRISLPGWEMQNTKRWDSRNANIIEKFPLVLRDHFERSFPSDSFVKFSRRSLSFKGKARLRNTSSQSYCLSFYALSLIVLIMRCICLFATFCGFERLFSLFFRQKHCVSFRVSFSWIIIIIISVMLAASLFCRWKFNSVSLNLNGICFTVRSSCLLSVSCSLCWSLVSHASYFSSTRMREHFPHPHHLWGRLLSQISLWSWRVITWLSNCCSIQSFHISWVTVLFGCCQSEQLYKRELNLVSGLVCHLRLFFSLQTDKTFVRQQEPPSLRFISLS